MAATKKDYFAALGRRKRSIARVRLYKGKGQTMVNAKPIEEYFKDIPSAIYLRPLEMTGNVGKYYATAKISGGGRLGQVGAFVLGLSRTLVSADEKYKSILRSAGFLTRDPREKERRKFGLAQGARARKQSPKR